MENLFLLLQLLGAVYIFLTSFIFSPRFYGPDFIGVLVYLSFTIMPAVINMTKGKKLAQTLLLTATAGACLWLQPFIYILPLSFARFFALTRVAFWFEAIVYFLPLSVLRGADIATYALCALMTLIIRTVVDKGENRAASLEHELNSLEAENYKLRHRISRLEEAENEKAYFIKLEERNAIARKLHDELGHIITGSLVQMEAARSILAEDSDRASKLLGNSAAVLRNGMDAIRSSLRSLKPDSGEFGLQTIKRLLGDFERDTGIVVACSTSGDLETITNQRWRVINANLKEALTNSLKHGGATKAAVEIAVLNRLIKAGFKDNGHGAAVIVPGLGLRGMEERTQEAGGSLVLDGSAGFSVIMLFRRE